MTETTETVEQEAVPMEEKPRLKPKIDITDSLTLMSRVFIGMILSAIAINALVRREIFTTIIFAILAFLVQMAAVALIRKIRAQNVDYIAQKAADMEAEEKAKQHAASR